MHIQSFWIHVHKYLHKNAGYVYTAFSGIYFWDFPKKSFSRCAKHNLESDQFCL